MEAQLTRQTNVLSNYNIILIRGEKEGRKKQARLNKQQLWQSNTTHPMSLYAPLLSVTFPPPPPPRPSCICVPPIYMYIQCLPAGADLAQTVLTKCVRTEGNIRSETFQLQLDFGFLQDMQDARKVKEKRSLFAAVRSASTNLLDPRERCHVYCTVCV